MVLTLKYICILNEHILHKHVLEVKIGAHFTLRLPAVVISAAIAQLSQGNFTSNKLNSIFEKTIALQVSFKAKYLLISSVSRLNILNIYNLK